MSDLMVDFIISLDGYAAADGWPGYWGMEGPEYLAWISEDTEPEHTWSSTARSTADSSCSSTFRRCSTGRPAPATR
jgi:hypothetical protein